MLNEPQDIISLVIQSKSYIEVFPDLNKAKEIYRHYSKLIHTDTCKLPNATDAMSKLATYYDEVNNGKSHLDDVGKVIYKINSCKIVTKDDKMNEMLKISLNNYNKLLRFNDKFDVDFQRYIPLSMNLNKDDDEYELNMNLGIRCLPIVSLGVLPQDHVNWILSRMLEYAAYLYQRKLVHCGFTPESVYVEPEGHGIRIVSFYHMKHDGERLSTVSGRFLNFYDSSVTSTKIADPSIDVEMVKKTAIYLLGDKSGIGNCLRRTHNNNFLDFISKKHENAQDAYFDYRAMLKKNFVSKFHLLTV